MPFRYGDNERIKAGVVSALWRGSSLRSLRAIPGMPGRHTIRRWAREDALFAQALDQGIGQGEWARRQARAGARGAFPEAQADAFVAAMRDGASATALYRRPGFPSRLLVDRWRRLRPDFDAAVRAAMAANAARPRPLAWPAYDEAVADRIILRLFRGEPLATLVKEKGLPGRAALDRWRRLRPDFAGALRAAQRAGNRARGRAGTTWTADWTERVVAGVRLGRSLHSLSTQPGMPPVTTMYNWVRTQPAFAAAVREAYADRAAIQDDLELERLWGVSRAEQEAMLAEEGEGVVLERRSALRRL